MDTVTQFLLGASLSGAIFGGRAGGVQSGPRLGLKAALYGGAVAVLPDLDTFIPYENAIDAITHHRGFSHSLIVQSIAAPIVAGVIAGLDKAMRAHAKRLLLAVWLALITHSLLDSLTTYGTQVFWPLEVGPPVAYPAVFIIDPVYSALLLAGLLAIVFGRRRGSGHRANRLLLSLATLYLGLGMIAHESVAARAAAHPDFAGKRIHVQPAPLNLLFWQVLGVDETSYVAGLATALGGCRIGDIARHPRRAQPPEGFSPPPAIRRYEWFTDGFFTYDEKDGALAITDLRIGYAPTFAFTFEIAQRGSAYEAIPPSLTGGVERGAAWLSSMFERSWLNFRKCRV